MVSVLDRKLWRDLRRMRGQGLAVALVLGAGVATLILALGAQRALEETRAAYYERNRFAHVFAAAVRAPLEAAERVALIPGVAAVEARIARFGLLDIPGQPEPATGLFVSTPRGGPPALNLPHMRAGRMPDPARPGEVVASEAFADAHGHAPGATFAAILGGAKREMTVVGIALSPEAIYALGPGDIVPDDLRFGRFIAPYETLAAAFDLDGAFNDLTVRLARGADEAAVIEAIDAILAPYGGTGAHGRADQQSHAFLDSELEQLRGMALIIPPIFLAVAAFLANVAIGRLVALEREQIGLLKALGYGAGAIAGHYLKLVAALATVGVVTGWAAGIWLGRLVTEIFAETYRFPFLIFVAQPDVLALSAVAALGAALGGAALAVRRAAALAPAVAMSPPAPPAYRRLLIDRLGLMARAPQALTMAVRAILRWPGRAAMTTLGLALSIAVLIGTLFAFDSVDFMIGATFDGAERQDATLTFDDARADRAALDAARLPGVIAAEPFRAAPVRLHAGPRAERTMLLGKPADADLNRIVDIDQAPVAPPDVGIALASALATKLGVGLGDRVLVEIMEGRRETHELPVTAIVQQYFGLSAYMERGALNRLLREGDAVSGVHVTLDPAAVPAFYAAIKETPAVAGLGLASRAVGRFRALIDENISTMVGVYAGLAAVIAFGVVYNSVRVRLSERARELASLRVLGFTRGETAMILLLELALLGLAAIPLGWGLGWLLAVAVSQGLQSDLYRVPVVVERGTYAAATALFLSVAALSALAARRRIDSLDLIAVLKTRE